MIKRVKDFEDIPRSLRTDEKSLLVNPARTTNERRLELIAAGKYIDKGKYNSRYKTQDIKDRLKSIHPTCCFCGFRDQGCHVEHYRPKAKYYWLAYSWDNLLLSCPICNQAKKAKFKINGEPVLPKLDNDVSSINNMSDDYDAQEKPCLINPEKVTEDELAAFLYSPNGHVSSEHPRVKYTIEVCDLDRDNLVEDRKAVWDSFVAKFNERIYDYRDNQIALESNLKSLIKDFVKESNDESLSFTAFRRYAIKAGWFRSLVDTNDAR